MNISKTETDALNASLHITIEPNDYTEKFNDELHKYKGKVQLKGFRKGKTPISTVKKMYGKAILAETINNLLSETLNNYLSENKLAILGQPIPSEDSEPIDFNVKTLGNFDFNFDLGLAPDFEINGLEDVLEKSVIEVEEDKVTEELDYARKRFGKEIYPEDNIEENDILTLKALELEEGAIKEKGWETGFQLMVKDSTDEVKESLLKLKKGEEFDFNIWNIEKDKDEKHVRKYLLNLDEGEEKEIGESFRGTIEKVSRIEPAELDQEFFDKYKGKENAETSEEEIRKEIRESIEGFYDKQSQNLLYKGIMDHLMEHNALDLPDTFLKRWMKLNKEDNTVEISDEEYENFAKSLKWSLIIEKLNAKYEVKVEPEDIKENFKRKISGYFGGNPQGIDLDEMANSLMQNQEQFSQAYEEEKTEKLFAAIADDISIKENKVTLEEFREIAQKSNEQAA